MGSHTCEETLLFLLGEIVVGDVVVLARSGEVGRFESYRRL